VTSDALDYSLRRLGLETAGLRDRLMDAYRTLDAFPEVPNVLRRLKRNGIKTAVLSNGSPEMLHAAISNAGITELLDEVLSVEEIGVYKPHPKVYQLAVDRLGVERQRISYQSSNAWDAWAASAFGMRVVWCNRYSQLPEHLPGQPDFQIASLADLPF
jgi:2-haloacid dehalogenase